MCSCQSIVLDKLSQNTNESIVQFRNLIWVTTINGVNVFNGKEYRNFNESNSNVIGNICQGVILSSKNDFLYYTSYNSLIKYDVVSNQHTSMVLQNEFEQTIESDYRAIKLFGDSILVLQLSSQWVLFSVEEERVIKYLPINTLGLKHCDAILIDDSIKLVAGDTEGLIVAVCGDEGCSVYESNNSVSGVLATKHGVYINECHKNLVFRTWNGELTWRDSSSYNCWTFISDYDDQFILIASEGVVTCFDKEERVNRFSINIGDMLGEEECDYMYRPYISPDSILWVGCEGIGVVAQSLKRNKFHVLTDSTFSPGPVFEMLVKDETVYLTSYLGRRDIHTCPGGYYETLPIKEARYVAEFGEDTLLISTITELFYYLPKKNYLKKLDIVAGRFNVVNSDNNGNTYLATGSNSLGLLKCFNGSWSVTPMAIACGVDTEEIYTHFFFDAHNRIYISNNEMTILVFDKDHVTFLDEINLKGGLLSLVDRGDHILITNYAGLYKINKSDFSYVQILDDKNKLAQQIYGLLIDDNGYYWMSTNNGIYRYDPRINHAHQFKMKDGLQGLEYNTMSYLKDSKGRFMFGGVNGLNVFDPLKVKLSDKQTPIDFYNYKINDADSREFGVANYVDKFDLSEKNNTITFEFVGIDYTGPEHVNLKYYMEGYDKDWVELEENNGVARYANLPYGDYTFHMLASNSDEVWADEAKTVDITVHPPFWATWWFQSLAGLLLLWSGYAIVRSYYRRKLERRDLILKQQSLIIEKQEAIEYERNRIASEMHDDLGSGLTTIKYLSEHAMKSSADVEERSKIKRIADHANNLVSNMSEIIWAMNSRYDTATDLVGYIRRYASEYLEEHQRTLTFSSEGISSKLEISGEKRRNLFLVTKEILHNFIKYANVNEMKINISVVEDQLRIEFLEFDSVGFDVEKATDKGNGLFNMKKRMKDIEGELNHSISDDGFKTILTYSV